MTTETIEIQQTITEELIPYEDIQDYGEHKAHIVNPPMNMHVFQPGMEGQDIVDVARAMGLEIVALCGFKFVPKRNPDKYDACELCMKEAERIMREMGE